MASQVSPTTSRILALAKRKSPQEISKKKKTRRRRRQNLERRQDQVLKIIKFLVERKL
jgi:hypothetical protein